MIRITIYKVIILVALFPFNLICENLEECKWNNSEGVPCLTIFSAPNTSILSEETVGKTVITKNQMINSGYKDVRDVLENIPGIDVYANGPSGQQTSIFMRGTNSNHTLVLLNGIPINDIGSPKAMFDFGYDFLQGLQQIEIYKGASSAIFGPAAIGGAVNFVTDIDYQNSFNTTYTNSRYNTFNGNYAYISNTGWHHNIKGGVSQAESITAKNSKKDLDGTKNISINYNSQKFLNDSLKFKNIGYLRKTNSGYDVSADENATAKNFMYAIQSSLESKVENKESKFSTHVHVYDRVYDEDVKNKYYSQSYLIKGERKIKHSENLSYGFGSDYNYAKGDFIVHGTYGSSAKGHMDNLGLFANAGFKTDNKTTLSGHIRGDSHKYSEENITYRLNATKEFNNLELSISESTGLRHPDLYVLHGGNSNSTYYNGSFKSMKTTKPETSKTRELTLNYNFANGMIFETTAYKSYVADVLNRNNNSGGYNEIIDINQEGLENKIQIKDERRSLILANTLSKSREGSGRPQLRRPEKTYNVNFSQNLNLKYFGKLNLNYDYKHVGKAEDFIGFDRKDADSTDIMNLSFSKDILGQKWFLNINNLTDEIYQRPDGYNQEGRRLSLSFLYKY